MFVVWYSIWQGLRALSVVLCCSDCHEHLRSLSLDASAFALVVGVDVDLFIVPIFVTDVCSVNEKRIICNNYNRFITLQLTVTCLWIFVNSSVWLGFVWLVCHG